ncbi:Sec39-domain-containing protein [Irpex rosettiformis]|uniref:Sec39-domain-containing protein n=1 Tax=Irpex rosettiformis TaxID=378272 RepID=A0ACB8UKX9_9APHY|nr:Sec39-domain-containing protein [Irpex rosettiformis]
MTSPSTSKLSSSASELSQQWIDLADEEITEEFALKCFDAVADDVWVVAACMDRLLEAAPLQRTLLEIGIKRTEPALRRVEVASEELIDGEDSIGTSSEDRKRYALASYFQDESTDAQLCQMRATLLERLDRLNTFVEVCKEQPLAEDETSQDDIDEEWEDDPWGDTTGGSKATTKTVARVPVSLSSFLVDDLADIACVHASVGCYSAVRVLIERHASSLWQYRFVILESIPEHILPTDFRDLLPSLDASSGEERVIQPRPWREEKDWVEQPFVQEILKEFMGVEGADTIPSTEITAPVQPIPSPSNALTAWYRQRVDDVLTNSGMLDNALSLVQHAASHGIAGMDEVGEEMSLLSRLVYEAPSDLSSLSSDWTLERWKKLDPPAVIRAYLADTPPDDVPKQINKLVMPYLFVLESRAERAGNPDPRLVTRLFHEYILQAPLEVVASIFEASKPTLPPAQRLLRDDEDMVRLALACLYGSDRIDEWPTMSRIFECLPAWEVQEDEDEADTTIASLGAFVTPSTTQPQATASSLLVFFQPLLKHSLSRALDILDVHLESGEILSRWSVPAPLRWFLQSNGNILEQRAWATRMARQAGGRDDRLESLDDWEWLLDDMLKLSGSSESGLKGAFCLLSGDEVLRIYLSGLLSTGRFDIARSMLRDPKSRLQLPATTVEEVSITTSLEFYDNANSGNYHFGGMKLAYNCLDVPSISERILQQKEFIEATSRLCSFNLTSSPGTPITPIEIRLVKDKLSLVSRVLSSNSDAYKHSQVILELVQKLGFTGDLVAEVKTLAMLSDTALTMEDFDCAYENCSRMVDLVLNLRASRGTHDPEIQQASEVCWVTCFQLGRHPEFEDLYKRGNLLGRAMELCPPERLLDVLTSWRRLDQEDLELRRARRAARRAGTCLTNGAHRKRRTENGHFLTETLASRLQSLQQHVPSSPLASAPEFANKALHSVAANFPFARGRTLFSEGGDRSRSGSRPKLDAHEVQVQASRALQKGLGWLLGDE